MVIAGIKIPADRSAGVALVEFDPFDYRSIQDLVGGCFEVVDLGECTGSMFANEDAKIVGLAVNRRATVLLWDMQPQWRGQDVIAGDVLILGRPDDEGDSTSVPHILRERLLGERSCPTVT